MFLVTFYPQFLECLFFYLARVKMCFCLPRSHQVLNDENEDGDGTTGNKVDECGEGATGDDNDDNNNDGDGTERHNNQIEAMAAAGGNNNHQRSTAERDDDKDKDDDNRS